MKTVRFSEVIKEAGKPDTHLLLVKPDQDRILQKAIKANRVVTLYQNIVGHKADHGEVGFSPGSSRQILIFPRTVKPFTGQKIVGIKYEVLEGKKMPKSRQDRRSSGPKKERRKTAVKRDPSPPGKIVEFPRREVEEDDENEALEGVKTQVRHALKELENGKQVAAFHILKRIVDG